MDFARPHRLYLLTLVPVTSLFLIWAAGRKKTAISRIGAPLLLSRLTGPRSRVSRHLKTLVWFLALIAVIMASAQPRWGTQPRVTAVPDTQLLFVLDVSTSMLAEDVKPDRLTRAKLVLLDLIDRLRGIQGTEVGLVLFAGAAFVEVPLTSDLGTLSGFVDAASPFAISRPGTALAEAIRVARDAFPVLSSAKRVILLATDGEAHEGDAVAAAREAAEHDITVFTIGFGSPEGERIPVRDDSGKLVGFQKDQQGRTVVSRLDEDILRDIATVSTGAFYRATTDGEEIAALTAAMTISGASEGESTTELQSVERYQWFVGLALLALVVEYLWSESSASVKRAPKNRFPRTKIPGGSA